MNVAEVVLVLSRLAQFATAMLVLGTSLFRLYFREGLEASPEVDHAVDRWLRPVLLLATVAALVSSITWLDMEAATMGDGLPDAVNLDTLSAVLFDTNFGHVWVWHLLAAALLLRALLIFRGSIRNWAANALIGGIAIALVVTLAWTGHAVMRTGFAGVVNLTIQMVHLLAGSAWLGSLPALGYVLYRSQGKHAEAWRETAHYILPRYSRAGYFAVSLILLTGCLNSLRLVGSVGGLTGTSYGRVLIVKIGLVAAMIAVALANRLGLAPVVMRAGSNALEAQTFFRALWRNVAIEQLLAVMVTAAVSVLGTLPPAFAG